MANTPERSQHAATVAAFDFDGTVTRGGSVVRFLLTARGFVPVALAIARLAPSLLYSAVAGGRAADRSKERLFVLVLAGLPEQAVAATGRSFAQQHLERRLRPEVAARLAWHRAQGHRVVLVSASPELYVREVGRSLGVDAVLATQLEVDADGTLTGRYRGRNCRGQEKRDRLVTWLQGSGEHVAATPTVWAYGNSRGDMHLLQAADHGVDVSALGRWGRLRRFPSLSDVASATPSEAAREAPWDVAPGGQSEVAREG